MNDQIDSIVLENNAIKIENEGLRVSILQKQEKSRGSIKKLKSENITLTQQLKILTRNVKAIKFSRYSQYMSMDKSVAKVVSSVQLCKDIESIAERIHSMKESLDALSTGVENAEEFLNKVKNSLNSLNMG